MPRRVPVRSFSSSERANRANRTAALVADAWEPGTRRNRASHLRQYEAFCSGWGVAAWPVSQESIGNFVSQWADRNHSAKVAGLISTLRTTSLERGCPFDVVLERYLCLLRRGLEKAYRPTTRRKLPFTLDRLESIVPPIDMANSWEFQALTMAYVAHDGLLRACELLALRWEDLKMFDDGSVALDIKVSKTTHTRPSETVTFATYERHGVLFCGASLLAMYVGRCRALLPCRGSDYLFPSSSGEKLDKAVFVGFMQSKLSQAGIARAEEYSGHSFRAGGATDLFSGGAPPRVIQLSGRWRSDAYLLYIRDHWHSRALQAGQAFSLAGSAQGLGVGAFSPQVLPSSVRSSRSR